MVKLENKEKKYIGWVPCLNGQLVFDLIECGLKKEDHQWIEVIYYGKGTDGEQTEYILAHSVVDWKDFGEKELTGVWSVVLLSKRKLKERNHEGTVYFMPKERHSEDWDKAEELMRNINLEYKTALKDETSPDLIKHFDQLQQKIDNASKAESVCYKAAFKLEENGIVNLNYCNKNKNKNSDDLDAKIITRQAYYYIKYTWHRHQHHDSRAETLTTCHEIPVESQNEEIAERLIGDLKRNLVRFKRGIDHSSHREVLKATGILSYTKSLVEIMKSKKFISPDSYDKEMNHLKYFQESLEAISSGIEKDISMHNSAVNDARAVILFIFAILTPALVVNRQAIENVFAKKTSNIDLPYYVQFLIDLYSNEVKFSFFVGFIVLLIIVIVSMQSRYGNFWIFWNCITKPVALIINDKNPAKFMSKAQIISFVGMFIGLSLMISMFINLISS